MIVIGYKPLGDEISYADAPLPGNNTKQHFTLPCDTKSDPIAWAKKYTERFKRSDVCVVIPGRAFDALGTRHGRGGGWYDRFLAHIPASWLRIGILDSSNYSHFPLLRESWDEPVDKLMIWDSSASWKVQETYARV